MGVGVGAAMYDILFICGHCGAHLSAEDNDVGVSLPCPQCSADISVPVGDVLFDCPECGKSILASADARGQSFHCFYCEMEIRVPEKGRNVEVSAQLPTTEELAARTRTPPEPERSTPPCPDTPDQRQRNQFMSTWGDYLAGAGLADRDEDKKTN